MNQIQIVILFTAAISLFFLTACNTSQDRYIIHSVNGYTFLDDVLTEFEAIAISNGKVEALGSFDDMMQAYGHFEPVDGLGRTMLPGLIDAHGHVMGLGFQELDVDVTGIRSLEETLETIRRFAEENPDLEWIRGRGWNQVLWEENEFPTAADIDRVVPDRPVWLRRIDGHAGWANTKAMEIAGISRDTPDLQGGKIHRDVNGNAIGIFIDTVMRYIEREVPERTPEERELALVKSLQKIAKHGLTGVHDAGIGADDWNLYKKFADENKLITRIYAMIAGTGDVFDKLSNNGPVHSYADDMLALRSVKISADGALGSRGAAMLENYSDDPGNDGLLFYDQDDLNRMLAKGLSAGYQMNIHAIGDAANRQVLNAFEHAYLEVPGADELRNRIEHAQIVHPDDIPRFVELNLIASMQPTHATSDMNMAEDRVGPDRIEGGYAWQKFLNQGTKIAAGSDFPVEDVNPFYGLYSAVTRQNHEGMPPEGWYAEEALSREEALKAFTIDAAYAAHQDEKVGSLRPGKWADFILIDQDYFNMPVSDIWKINVVETWIAGEKIWSGDE
ncbi:MAG: amidohydrolase [Balneolaceae bacterium]